MDVKGLSIRGQTQQAPEERKPAKAEKPQERRDDGEAVKVKLSRGGPSSSRSAPSGGGNVEPAPVDVAPVE